MNNELKVLYVEDEEHIRNEMVEILELDYPNLYVASNGEEGLAQYNEHHPDLIISDVQMPKLDGLSMCKRIRSMDKNVVIMITSAFAVAKYGKEIKDIGIAAFITKPISIVELDNAIQTHCLSPKKTK